MAFLNKAVSDWLANTNGCCHHDEDAVFYPHPLESGKVSKSCDYHVINVSLQTRLRKRIRDINDDAEM